MQGFNMGRYVPPEHEGTTTGNKLHGKKPPGFRGDKQTIRFEMPFNVFCLTCDGHIAQGVRFNAEKKKVGNYFSTPIYSFRMRHTVCSGWIEIRTDPKNTVYVVTAGAKKKAADEDTAPQIIKIRDPDEPVEDPFAKKEKEVADKTEAKQGAARIAELRELSDRQWADPYAHSRKMRRVFRAERTALNEKAAAAEAILDRAGLSIELLDESPEDVQRAKLVEFGPDIDQKIEQAYVKPLFEKESETKPSSAAKMRKLKSQHAMENTRDNLQKSLVRNTRVAVDPFLTQERPRSSIGLRIKRKARGVSTDVSSDADVAAQETEGGEKEDSGATPVSLGLDGYDSE